MLILLAGLQSRPLDVIEAATIDGANSWQIFRYMTLPHLRQYIELSALLGVDLRRAELRLRLHHHLRRPGHREPALHHLPDLLHRPRLRPASAAGVVVVIGTIIIATFALRTRVEPVQGGVAMSELASESSTLRSSTTTTNARGPHRAARVRRFAGSRGASSEH